MDLTDTISLYEAIWVTAAFVGGMISLLSAADIKRDRVAQEEQDRLYQATADSDQREDTIQGLYDQARASFLAFLFDFVAGLFTFAGPTNARNPAANLIILMLIARELIMVFAIGRLFFSRRRVLARGQALATERLLMAEKEKLLSLEVNTAQLGRATEELRNLNKRLGPDPTLDPDTDAYIHGESAGNMSAHTDAMNKLATATDAEREDRISNRAAEALDNSRIALDTARTAVETAKIAVSSQSTAESAAGLLQASSDAAAELVRAKNGPEATPPPARIRRSRIY